MIRSMREAVRYIAYQTLTCSKCGDYLESYPPETVRDLVGTAKACGWIFKKGELFCGKCKVILQKAKEMTEVD